MGTERTDGNPYEDFSQKSLFVWRKNSLDL